jgi:hypothetical protein
LFFGFNVIAPCNNSQSVNNYKTYFRDGKGKCILLNIQPFALLINHFTAKKIKIMAAEPGYPLLSTQKKRGISITIPAAGIPISATTSYQNKQIIDVL